MKIATSPRLLAAIVLLLFAATFLGGGRVFGGGTLPVFGALLGAGLLVGLIGFVFKPAPLVLAGLVVLAYAGFVAWMAVGTVQCPHCQEGDGDRVAYFTFFTVLFGILAFLALVFIGAGALLASWLRRAGRDS